MPWRPLRRRPSPWLAPWSPTRTLGLGNSPPGRWRRLLVRPWRSNTRSRRRPRAPRPRSGR
eukprot:7603393-Lingulodinium_polyedra.AAC.1